MIIINLHSTETNLSQQTLTKSSQENFKKILLLKTYTDTSMNSTGKVLVAFFVLIMSFSSPILIASVPVGLAQSGTLPSGYNIEYNLSYNGTVFDLYYPNTGSNFPLIVYSGGTGGGKNGETSNAIYFAENGYACLWYATTANSADIYEPASKSNCLSLLPMIFNSTTMNLVCGISIDESAVALTGFSGGAGAILSINDTRIRTIVTVIVPIMLELVFLPKTPVLF